MKGPHPGAEVQPGPPPLRPGDHVQVAVRGPGGSWEKHPVLLVAAGPEGLEFETALRATPAALRAGASLRCSHRAENEILCWPSTLLKFLPAPGRFLASLPVEHLRVQRRRFARVEVELPVSFTADSSGTRPSGAGVTADVGAGGISLVTPSWLERGQRLWVLLTLSPGQHIEAEARVVAVARRPSAGVSGRYGLEFTRLEGARELLFRHIFQEQARRRRLDPPPRGGRRS